jgi:TonB family protein
LLIAVLLLPLRFAWAGKNDFDKQLKSDYAGKTLMLRHFYGGEHLRFHPDGTLQGNASVGPWTLDALILAEKVHLRGGLLVIKGRRIYLSFNSQRKPQKKSMTADNTQGKSFIGLEKTLSPIEVEITIELPGNKPELKDVASSIQTIFLTGSESMLDIVPSYWRAYFAKQEGMPQPVRESKDPVWKVNPGGGVSAPRAIYSPDPVFSEEARQAKFQGTAVIFLIIDASGTARDIQIQRPLGMGLDEKAVEAVSTWKFKPAQKDGEPVSVQVSVEVTFHLY